jgi:prepilin-type N-terminal cleavage/methylation domain-containing protein
MSPGRHAFTLIELLFVVATIAVLAAIAVPNFLEAQVRSKVSRTHSDLATLDMGLRSYFADHNAYPPNQELVRSYVLDGATTSGPVNADLPADAPLPGVSDTAESIRSNRTGRNLVSGYDLALLTTPVAYIGTQLLADTFADTRGLPLLYFNYSDIWSDAQERGIQMCRHRRYLLLCYSADTDQGSPNMVNPVRGPWIPYDPTNGTVSAGDIFRFGGQRSMHQPCDYDLPIPEKERPQTEFYGELAI